MSNFHNNKIYFLLIIILLLGVFVMPNNFIKDIIKNANDLIKYKNTVTTGEITVDNGDRTYDVKIANANNAYPNVETINYDAVFSVGEIVDIIFEQGCKEAPKIIGHSKKIKQEPKQVEVDYSGGCAGIQTVTTTIYYDNQSSSIGADDLNYFVAHDANGIILPSYEGKIAIENTYMGPELSLYDVERGFIYFNTSIIPESANIINAILSFIVEDFFGTGNLVIQNGQPNHPSSILTLGDFLYSYYSNNGGQYTGIGGLSLVNYNNITLNSNGRNWVNKGGITKFCLRMSGDISKTIPTDENGLIILLSTENIKLTINYEI